MKTCSTCTLCCKLLHVPELNKPMHEWCGFCMVGYMCTRYGNRPESCRQFKCLWLTDESMPDELRPDKLHAIFLELHDTTTNETRIGVVHDQSISTAVKVARRLNEQYDIVNMNTGQVIPKGRL